MQERHLFQSNAAHSGAALRRGLAILALALAAGSAFGQQVQVFSDGKPIATVDEGNGSRLRAHNDSEGRKPLATLAQAQAIANAHAAAFLHCGLNEASYPPEKPLTPEERDYFVKNSNYVPIAGGNTIILIDEYARGKAVVDLDKMSVITPQCPAGVRSLFWSRDTERIVFASLHVTGITFHGNSRALWTAAFQEPQEVWYSDSKHRAFRKLMNLPKERVLDVMLPDQADHFFVLSQTDKLDLRGVRKLWQAVTGSPARKVDILLRKVDLQGKTLETITVAQGVAGGSALFMRD
jgi:hypothetical protein